MIERHFLSPARYAEHMSGGQFLRPKHIQLIDAEVMRTLLDDRWEALVVQCPPRHGKSWFCSRWFPSWYHQVWPQRHSMLTSYAVQLARNNSRWVRQSIDDFAEIWGNKGLAPGVKTATEWQTAEGGGMFATGIGGGATGRPAHVLLLDDVIKNHKEAINPERRRDHWEWFQSTAFTRLEPGGKIIVLACLVGDTEVSMSNGGMVAIRDVQPGDSVLTFDGGRLSCSKVLNHTNVGKDEVFRITLASGKTITGNARHPFLVNNNGVLEWVRLKNLNTGLKIVTVKDSGESGKGRFANGMDALVRQNAEDTAIRITTEKELSTDTILIQKTRRLKDNQGSNTGTELHLSNTTFCCCGNDSFVQSASNRQQPRTRQKHSAVNCALTIATKPEELGGYCATIAISQSDTLEPAPPPMSALDTSSFTSDRIISIDYVGVEEVFDIEVEETESFIANGMVSHNTRWYDDDLLGRLLQAGLETGIGEDDRKLRIREVRLPALAEPTESTPDPLGRSTDEALWPERYPTEVLKRKRRLLDPYWWDAVYQQRPSNYGSNEWPSQYFWGILAQNDEWPDLADIRLAAIALDPSKGKDARKGDPSAIVYVGYKNGYFWVDADIRRRPIPEMVEDWVNACIANRPTVTGVESVAFQETLKDSFLAFQTQYNYYSEPELIENTIAKPLRIGRLGYWLRLHMIKIRNSVGGRELLRQMKEYPNSDHDDGPDALEMALRLIIQLSEELQSLENERVTVYE